jgi:thiol-disulfide isomerase/thioredoxin
MPKRWVGIGLVMAMAASATADPAPPTVDEAIRSSIAAKKPLVAEFGAAWCGPCKAFEESVLPQSDVQRALVDVVFVRYDIDVSPGVEAAERFGISAYPTFVVIDVHGKIASTHQGFADATQFVAFVASAKDRVIEEADIRAELRARPRDPAAHMHAARWFAEHHRWSDAIAEFTAVAKDSMATPRDRSDASLAVDRLRRLDAWRREIVGEKAAAVRRDPLTVPLDDLATAVVDSGLPRGDIHELIVSTLIASTDVARTNSTIYVALAAGAKDEALAAAKKLVGTSRQAQFLDTLAECLVATGDLAQALKIEDEALGMSSPLAPLLKRNRARFLGGFESDDVVQLRLRVADVWTRLETVDHLARHVDAGTPTPVPTGAPRMAELRKALEAERQVIADVATACATVAGASQLAVARVRLGLDGRVLSSLVLTDEAATPKLRACITREVAKAVLPPLPMTGSTQRDLRIDLKSSGTPRSP